MRLVVINISFEHFKDSNLERKVYCFREWYRIFSRAASLWRVSRKF